jgi:hypothetical protein
MECLSAQIEPGKLVQSFCLRYMLKHPRRKDLQYFLTNLIRTDKDVLQALCDFLCLVWYHFDFISYFCGCSD